MSSQLANVIALYFAFAAARRFCFLLYHDIKLSQTRTQYPKVQLLKLGDPAQSTSEYPTI